MPAPTPKDLPENPTTLDKMYEDNEGNPLNFYELNLKIMPFAVEAIPRSWTCTEYSGGVGIQITSHTGQPVGRINDRASAELIVLFINNMAPLMYHMTHALFQQQLQEDAAKLRKLVDPEGEGVDPDSIDNAFKDFLNNLLKTKPH